MSKIPNHLYVLQCDKYYKIGISWSVDRRMKSMKTSTPYDINLIVCYVIKGVEERYRLRSIEKFIHHHFLSKRKTGEWFDLSKEDLEQIPVLIKQSLQKNSSEYKNPKMVTIDLSKIKES